MQDTRDTSRLRRASKVALIVALLPVVLVLLLQVPPVRTAVVNRVLGAVGPWEGMELKVRDTAGSVVWSLGLSDLSLVRSDGSDAMRIDTVGVRWSPSALFRRTLALDEVFVGRVTVTARRDSTGEIDLARPFMGVSDEPSAWRIAIDRLELEDGTARIESDTAGTWTANRIRIVLTELLTGDDLRLEVDSLRADIADPGSSFPGLVEVRASISGGVATIDTLLFRTASSSVTGSGALRLPAGDAPTTDSLRFRLSADPLALSDLSPLFPVLNPDGVLRVGVDVRGEGRNLEVRTDAVAGDSGRFSLHFLTRVGTDSVAWSGRIEADRLSPGAVLADGPAGEIVSGQGSFRLSGPIRDRLSGLVQLELSAANIAGFGQSAVSLEQSWNEGRADTRIALKADRAEVRVTGWIEPLAVVPEYAFKIRTTGFEWNGGFPVRAGVEATLRGSGLDLDAEARLEWHPLEVMVGGCRVTGDGGSISILGRRIAADANILQCGAPIRLAANLDLGETRPWTLRSLELVDVPVVPIDSVAGRISAVISGSGVLDASGSPTGSLQVAAGSVEWGGVRMDSVTAAVSLLASKWVLDVDAIVAGGEVRGRASGSGSAADLNDIAFNGFDLSRLRDGSLASSSLSGHATGRVDWSGPVSGTFDIRLDESRFSEQVIESLHVAIGLREGEGSLIGTADLHGGRIDVDAAFGLYPDSMWVRVPEARFSGIDVAAWSGMAIETALAGTAAGMYSSSDSRADGRFDLTFDEGSLFRGVVIAAANLEVRIDPDSTSADLDVRFRDQGSIKGRFRMGADSTYRVAVAVDSLDAARLAFADSSASRIDGRLRADGRGFAPHTAAARLTADLTGSFGAIDFGVLTAAAGIDDGLLTLDTLRSEGRLGSLDLAGSLPLPGARTRTTTDLRGTIDIRDMEALARLTGIEDLSAVESSARVRIRGSERGMAISASTSTGGLVARRIHIATLTGTVSAEIGPDWMLRAAEVRMEAGTLSLPSTTAEEANVVATLRPDTIYVDADIRFTDRRQARASAVVTDSLRHVSILSFEALLDDAEWALLSPADLELGDGFQLSGAVLQAAGQRIAAGGGFGSESSNLYVTADSVNLDAVANLLGFRGLGMTIGGALTGTGTVDRPQMNGVLQAGITVNGRRSADVVIATALADQLLQIDSRIVNASGGEATVQGSLSLEGDRIADGPVNMDVEADSLAITWLLPFLDRNLVSDVGGRVTGRVEVRGTFQEPDMTGRATLRGGWLGLRTLGRPRSPLKFTDIETDLAFERAAVHVERGSARSGPGTLHATGVVNLEQLTLGRFALDITSSDFLAIDDAAFRAFAASNVHLSGTTREPVLSGSVRITRGDFYMTGEKAAAALEPVELEPADLLALEQRFGIRVTAADTTQGTFYDQLTIENLRMDFERDTWLRSASNPKMDVRFTGSLDVQKAPRSEPVVFGTIRIVPEQSKIEQFGRRFDIERGELSFSGPMTAPEINLAATYEVRAKGTTREEVTIRLVATGRPENLRIDFGSDPAMDLSDIISYIATGRPASSSLQFQGSGDGYLNTAAGLAMGPIAGVIEDVAGAGLGLDVVEIEHDGLSGLTLTAGKYVSPRFYVAVRQPISFASGTETTSAEQSSRTQVSMEYELLREILVSLLSRGAVLRVQLRWEHAF